MRTIISFFAALFLGVLTGCAVVPDEPINGDRHLSGKTYHGRWINGPSSGNISLRFSSSPPYSVAFTNVNGWGETRTWEGAATVNSDGTVTVKTGTARTDQLWIKDGKLVGTYSDKSLAVGSPVAGRTTFDFPAKE